RERKRMSAPLVECVPNFSEGRDSATLDALRAAITSVPGVRLRAVQAVPSHPRSVFTLVAPPAAAAEAAFRAMRVATECIDLTKQRGEHPRMGATDVVPFVPVRDVTMDECVAVARRLAERAAAELGIPIYLYARAATRPERERLPDIRKGEFEGLRDRIGRDPAADPDFGPTPPARVSAAVEPRGRARGIEIQKGEVVGLVPERAILAAGAAYLKVPDAADHLLEEKIRAVEGPTLDGWLEELAGGAPA